MNVCDCTCTVGFVRPFSKRGPPMCLFRGPRPDKVYITDKNNKTEGTREQKKGKRRINQDKKKDKGNWKKGPKVSSCLNLG